MATVPAAGVFIRAAASQVAESVDPGTGVEYQLGGFPVCIFGREAQSVCRLKIVYRQRASECSACNSICYFYRNGTGAYFLQLIVQVEILPLSHVTQYCV